jgi:SAM-dependent methyltransferase
MLAGGLRPPSGEKVCGMAYHDFPWQKGSSDSFAKLLSLSLPALQGKSVLDVGCNEGYFCGWAAFQKAALVHGIDREPRFIEQARVWFPSCTFSCKDWTNLGARKYDVILCLSALHYAADQEALIRLLMNTLEPDGLLVLEIGVAEGDAEEFTPIARSVTAENDDTRLFPTFAKVRAMLAPYAHKYMGQSVMQRGDPLPRHVIHVQRKRPLAVLFMDGHYSGKSTVSGSLLRPDIFRVYGEKVYHGIHDGEIAASAELKQRIGYVEGTRHMMPPAITTQICKDGLLPQLAGVFFELAGQRDFVLEHYIPPGYRLKMAELCDGAGYFVVDVALFTAHKKDAWVMKRPAYAQYEAYRKYLERLCDIDEQAYLATNPDVARAVAEGKLPDAKYHYRHFGRREKRKLR